jgi:hypothetical protein
MLGSSSPRRTRIGGLRLVPPAPEVLTYLAHEYHKNWKKLGFSFSQFLVATGYENPAHDLEGLDDDLVRFPSRLLLFATSLVNEGYATAVASISIRVSASRL